MSYATPAQFRARYPEFAELGDAAVQVALDVADADLKGYLPPGDFSAEALLILADRSLPLARLALYQDEALGDEHQAIRDAENVRQWLRMVALGQVQLGTTGGATKAPTVVAKDAVFSDWSTY